MARAYLTLLVFLVFICESAIAQRTVDCRVVTGSATECNPYGSKLIRAKEIKYNINTTKLIISKNLPVPPKVTMKVISVEDMIEKYLEVEDSLRFRGSSKRPFNITVEDEPIEVPEEMQVCKVPPRTAQEIIEHTESDQPPITYGKYIVVKGDALSKLAKKFGLTTKALAKLNGLKIRASLCIGQELKLPFEQKRVDAWISAEYKVEDGDTLISIAKKFNLEPKVLVSFNDIKSNTDINRGKIIKLPLPYVLEAKKKAEVKKKKLDVQQKSGKLTMIQDFGKRKLRVTATAYSSHSDQTDSTPFLAAWGNRLRPGMKAIAVSRDLLSQYGIYNGAKVRVGGLSGYYTVRDKMNKRYKKRIDIYMGMDRRSALRWGRRSVVISW